MILLGLTGSIGMGKSTTAAMLQDLGVPVHDSDAAARLLLEPGGHAMADFQAAFPQESYPALYKAGGAIDRAALGALVFSDAQEKRKLEAVLHPAVQAAQGDFVVLAETQGHDLAALDIPLLFETAAERRVHYTIIVTAPHFIQKKRVLARPGMDEARFRSILDNQMPDTEKRRRADFVLQTGFGRWWTKRSLKKILQTIRQKEGLTKS